jgi:hypothetical protein
MATIELDLVIHEGEKTEWVADDLAEGLDVTYHVVAAHGPAGGWPVVEFTGSDADIKQVQRRYDLS